jgi:pyridoxamine 5'-phosphate oxidase
MKRHDEMDDSKEKPRPLGRRDMHPDPFAQFARWFDEARIACAKLPEAMTLATASSEGVPSARMVLLKGFDERGFVFFTNYESQKGRELDRNPNAALVFYWSELDRQVRISGRTIRTSSEESDEYFRTRPIESRLSAWASRQSQPIASREILKKAMAEAESKYQGQEVPLPPYWGGYLLSPTVIEFWQNRPSRLHDRFRYTREPDGRWRLERLSP